MFNIRFTVVLRNICYNKLNFHKIAAIASFEGLAIIIKKILRLIWGTAITSAWVDPTEPYQRGLLVFSLSERLPPRWCQTMLTLPEASSPDIKLTIAVEIWSRGSLFVQQARSGEAWKSKFVKTVQTNFLLPSSKWDEHSTVPAMP